MPKPSISNDSSFDDLLREIEEAAAAKRLRLDNPYVLDLIRVLYPYGTVGRRRIDIIDRVGQQRRERGVPMPTKLDETVQSAFQHYCVGSDVFKKEKRPLEEGLFLWPKGKGAGVWAIYREKADAWLKARKAEL